MKKRNLLLVILAALLVFGMVVGCGDLPEGDGTGTTPGGTTEGTLSGVSANGSATVTTTSLTLTFTKAATISVDDITLSGAAASNVTKGTLTVNTAKTTYTLAVTVTGGGALDVKVGSVTKSTTVYWLDPFAKYYNNDTRSDKYYTTYPNSAGTKTVTESIIIKKDKITFYDNDRSNDNPDKIEFTVTKWENANVPASVNTAYGTSLQTYTKGVKVTGKITDARPPDNASAAATTQVYGSTTCPGITKADIGVTELYFFIYFDDTTDPTQFFFVKSAFFKTGVSNQSNPIEKREYKENVAD
jgi:hypothetical protein